jgi:hypothetical protein
MTVDAMAGNDDDGYAASVGALTALVSELPAHPPVTPGRMFNGDGVQVRGRFFAFIGRNGDLIAKLPAPRVLELVGQQAGAPVVRAPAPCASGRDSRSRPEWGSGVWSSVRRTSSCLRGRIRLWSSANGDRLILADATVCPSAE